MMVSMEPDFDVDTETITSPRGWAAVRVTHRPTGMVAERERSQSLRSAVQAQQECVEELRQRLANGPAATNVTEPGTGVGGPVPDVRPVAVSRAEFDALAARVTEVEERLRRLGPR